MGQKVFVKLTEKANPDNASLTRPNNPKKVNIFLVAGRTGGPFFPLPAIAKALSDYNPIYIGIKGGFEDKVATKENFEILYLPEARFTLLSFGNTTKRQKFRGLAKTVKSLMLLVFSFFKSLFLILKYRPKLIYSTGSFLSVPLIFAAKLSNFLALTNTKVAIHQQDPLPGLANKLTIDLADLKSCVFEYTKSNFPKFSRSGLIPNPIDAAKYIQTDTEDKLRLSKLNLELSNFIYNSSSSKPLLLVFGGGSGSESINDWLINSLGELLGKFRILHLTGLLQRKEVSIVENLDYFSLKSLFQEMPLVLKKADLVICRSGLGSISELLFLNKPGFLIPLPNSHQEINAQLVKDYFYILEQKNMDSWTKIINENYPQYFANIKYQGRSELESELGKYYIELRKIISSN